ncbi:hypothetical protein RRG08_020404 [Elysia crispata]|uniref:Uncharacterized protein n=1 Tax=Elysia crispata TaxID=231223 RepID=A0AAE1B5C0_9GAST|nr:hypothetical protein RRG08_020404 [Elysia crispata]
MDNTAEDSYRRDNTAEDSYRRDNTAEDSYRRDNTAEDSYRRDTTAEDSYRRDTKAEDSRYDRRRVASGWCTLNTVSTSRLLIPVPSRSPLAARRRQLIDPYPQPASDPITQSEVKWQANSWIQPSTSSMELGVTRETNGIHISDFSFSSLLIVLPGLEVAVCAGAYQLSLTPATNSPGA